MTLTCMLDSEISPREYTRSISGSTSSVYTTAGIAPCLATARVSGVSRVHDEYTQGSTVAWLVSELQAHCRSQLTPFAYGLLCMGEHSLC